jgi:hypothetical protein
MRQKEDKQENDRNSKQNIKLGFDVLATLIVMLPIPWNPGPMQSGRLSPIFWRNTLLPSSLFKMKDMLMKQQASRWQLAKVCSCKTSVTFYQIAPPHDPEDNSLQEINRERI